MRASTACARRCTSSTSGWSLAIERTRAITRLCPVMRSRLEAQSRSMRLAWSSEADIFPVARIFDRRVWAAPSDAPTCGSELTSERERQVDRVFGRVAWALIVSLASPDFCKAQLLVEPERRRVAGGNFQIEPACFGLPGRPAEGFDQA